MSNYFNDGGYIYDGAIVGEKTNIKRGAVIYPNSKIGENATIDIGSIIYPGSVIGDNCYIGPYSIIGSPVSSFYEDQQNHKFNSTLLGDNAILRSNVVIYEGSNIGKNFQTGHHITIREETNIGDNCSLGTLSDIQGKCDIGNFVRMHSNVHIGQLTKVEDYVWLFPYVMTTNDMYPPHDKLEGCTIKKYAIVGASTVLLPGKIVGENSFIAAGSLVTKNIEDNAFAMGRPAIKKMEISELKDKDGNLLYPWKDYLEEYRGYPWQQENTEMGITR